MSPPPSATRCGHVLRLGPRIGLDSILDPDGNRCRDLVLALLVAVSWDPSLSSVTARALAPTTAASRVGEASSLGKVDDDELYAALDWLLVPQPAIATRLAKRHLKNGSLVLYDASSSYMAGRRCPLAKHDYSRGGKPGTLQIVYGLLGARDSCPVAIEVFATRRRACARRQHWKSEHAGNAGQAALSRHHCGGCTSNVMAGLRPP